MPMLESLVHNSEQDYISLENQNLSITKNNRTNEEVFRNASYNSILQHYKYIFFRSPKFVNLGLKHQNKYRICRKSIITTWKLYGIKNFLNNYLCIYSKNTNTLSIVKARPHVLPINKAMMAMTTNSSINVKPRVLYVFIRDLRPARRRGTNMPLPTIAPQPLARL